MIPFLLRNLDLHSNPRTSPFFSISSRFLYSKTPSPVNLDIPSSARYDELIYDAGRNRDFDTVRQFLNKRMRDGFFNTTNTFKFLTGATRDLPSVVDDLSQTLARVDAGFARKGAFDSLIARLCKLNQADEAVRVVEKMVRGGGFGANACTIHPILNSLSRKKSRIREAWRVMEVMSSEWGIAPDVTAYNYLLTAYCFAGEVAVAAGVLEKMAAEGMAADGRTYDALVLGACKGGKVEGALALLRRMEEEGLPLLYSTHSHVINAMVQRGYYAQVVKFVVAYGGRKDKGLDTESFGCLATRLIESKRIVEATAVLEEMLKRDLPMGHKLKDFCKMHFIC